MDKDLYQGRRQDEVRQCNGREWREGADREILGGKGERVCYSCEGLGGLKSWKSSGHTLFE